MAARLALRSDLEQWVVLARRAHEESIPYVVYSEAKVRATFQRYLDTAHPTITVVEDRDLLLAGFATQSISEYPSGVGLYTTLEVTYVLPERRGTRAAAHLLRWFVDWSDNMVGAIEATGGNDNQLRSENTARLFGRFGFEQVGFFLRRRKGAGADGQEGRD